VHDFLAGEAIHQPQAIYEHRLRACEVADTQPVEAMESIRGDLDSGADLAKLGRLFEHYASDALAGKPERDGYPADATARDNHWQHTTLPEYDQYYAHTYDEIKG
jgi:hypothetical protein